MFLSGTADVCAALRVASFFEDLSAYYGVSSKQLGTGELDKTGLNKGLADLASGAEILAYYDEVMRHQCSDPVDCFQSGPFSPVRREKIRKTNRLHHQVSMAVLKRHFPGVKMFDSFVPAGRR